LLTLSLLSSRISILSNVAFLPRFLSSAFDHAGIPWAQLSRDGQIIATSGPARTDPRLLRAQAAATGSRAGLETTRALLMAKLDGQAANLRDILRLPGAATMISEYGDELGRCDELDAMRTWEANAGSVYWQAWADRVTVPFPPGVLITVPAHWRVFTGRTSLLNQEYRKYNRAIGPINALLNYVYRLAETEAVHACHELGLHPALGILHADKPGRDSMPLDILEAARPACDALILAMLDYGLGVPYDDRRRPRYLDRRWLNETREGLCVLVPPLTHRLASYMPRIGATLLPHAQHAAGAFAASASGDVRLPATPVARFVKTAPVPVSSKRPARLRSGVTVADLLPDHVWETVRSLVPKPPRLSGSLRRGRPPSLSDREVVAALAAHVLLCVPWSAVPVSMSYASARGRLLAWQWAQVNVTSAWDRICEQLQAAGHLSQLVA
jgi:CRISPR-associated endonuclease Cas1